jgi:mRNA degradation ribonuclease J1/J2
VANGIEDFLTLLPNINSEGDCEKKLIALIIEGTRIADETREESEELVFNESRKIVSARS